MLYRKTRSPFRKAILSCTRSIAGGRRRGGGAVGSCGGCCSAPTSSGSSARISSRSHSCLQRRRRDSVAPIWEVALFVAIPPALGPAGPRLRALRSRRRAHRSLDGRRRRRRVPGRDARDMGLPRHHARSRPSVPEPGSAGRVLASRRCSRAAAPSGEPGDRTSTGRIPPERDHRRLGSGRAPARRQDREPSRVRPAGRRDSSTATIARSVSGNGKIALLGTTDDLPGSFVSYGVASRRDRVLHRLARPDARSDSLDAGHATFRSTSFRACSRCSEPMPSCTRSRACRWSVFRARACPVRRDSSSGRSTSSRLRPGWSSCRRCSLPSRC